MKSRGTSRLQLASLYEYRAEDPLVVVLQAVVVPVEGFQDIKDVIGSVQNPIRYGCGKVGEFALRHGLRTAHFSQSGRESLFHLDEVPGGCARALREATVIQQVRAAAARQRFSKPRNHHDNPDESCYT